MNDPGICLASLRCKSEGCDKAALPLYHTPPIPLPSEQVPVFSVVQKIHLYQNYILIEGMAFGFLPGGKYSMMRLP